MSVKFNEVLAAAVLRLLKPLARILLHYGIPYGVLADLARQAYVDVAWREYQPRDRRQTISHVSALTGLTRKEVKRLVDAEGTLLTPDEARYSRAIRVISGWSNDRAFHNDDGKPAELPLEGGQRSFAALARKYSGDIPARAMLNVLLEGGSVRVTDDRVRLLRNAYVPASASKGKIEILGRDVAELMSTIGHNLVANDNELRFQRKVTHDRIEPHAVPRLRALSAKKAQALLEALDREYARHDMGTGGGKDGATVSVGIYYYEHDPAAVEAARDQEQ